MSEEIGSTEDLVNPELTKNVAEKLLEKFESLQVDGEKLVTDDSVWIEIAKVAIAMLQPIAVNSELPNDAQHGSGVAPLEEKVDEPVGGQVDPSVPDEAKSGE